MVEVKVKRLEKDANLPIQSSPNVYDIWMYNNTVDMTKRVMVCRTGLAFDIPEGYIGLVVPRYRNYEFFMCMGNSIGVIHPGHGEDELIINFRLIGEYHAIDKDGNVEETKLVIPNRPTAPARIVQLVVLPIPQTVIVENE